MKKFALIPFGFLSGLISFVLVHSTAYITFFIFPGLIFGCMFVCYILLFNIKTSEKYFLFILTCFAANLIASFIGMLNIFVAGIAGTILLVMGFSESFRKLIPADYTILSILGGLLTTGYFIIPEGSIFKHVPGDILAIPKESILTLYIVWQTSMFFLLGLYLSRSDATVQPTS